MTVLEAKNYARKYLGDYFIKNSFIEKKSSSSTLEYRRKNSNGYDGFAIGTNHYNPKQYYVYSLYKRIDAVEAITKVINESVAMNPPINKDTVSLAFGYEIYHNYRPNGGFLSIGYLPAMQTEEEARSACTRIIEFLEEDALPLLDRFNDLQEIDKIINGDDFWRDDWQMPFNLGGNFVEKQFIIAKLVGGQKHLDEVIEKHRVASIKYWAEKGEVVNCPYLTNLETPIGFTIQYLKNVEPLYS